MARFVKFLTYVSILLLWILLGISLRAQEQPLGATLRDFLLGERCAIDKGKYFFNPKVYILSLEEVYRELSPIYKDREIINALLYEWLAIRRLEPMFADIFVTRDDLVFVYCENPEYIRGEREFLTVALLDSEGKGFEKLRALLEKYRFNDVSFVTFTKDIEKAPSTWFVSQECELEICEQVRDYDPLRQREYRVSVEVEYAEQVVNPQAVDVVVRLTSADFALPDSEVVPLTIREVSPQRIPQLYSPDWEDFKVVRTINEEVIPPNREQVVKFRVGPFLDPGVKSGRFALFLGDTQLPNTEFEVSINFEKGDYRLAIIDSQGFRAVNVRAEPDLNAELLFRLVDGEYVIWHRQEGAWVYIETAGGSKGWVYRRYIRPLD